MTEQEAQMNVRQALAAIDVNPTCRFGPTKYAQIEGLLTDMVLRAGAIQIKQPGVRNGNQPDVEHPVRLEI